MFGLLLRFLTSNDHFDLTKTNITDDTVECTMDHKKGLGKLDCRVCAAQYQMPIHHLTEPIDVFSEWLDDCEAAQRGETPAAAPKHSGKDDDRNESIDLGAEDSSDDEDE
jgi:transcription elongation factor Elf1